MPAWGNAWYDAIPYSDFFILGEGGGPERRKVTHTHLSKFTLELHMEYVYH